MLVAETVKVASKFRRQSKMERCTSHGFVLRTGTIQRHRLLGRYVEQLPAPVCEMRCKQFFRQLRTLPVSIINTLKVYFGHVGWARFGVSGIVFSKLF